jgi:hypothetical protein
MLISLSCPNDPSSASSCPHLFPSTRIRETIQNKSIETFGNRYQALYDAVTAEDSGFAPGLLTLSPIQVQRLLQ